MKARTRWIGIVGALVCCALLAPAGASAVNIPVTTTADVSADDDVCSLREAIQAAQTNTAVGPLNTLDCPAGLSGSTDFVQLSAATYSMAGATNEDLNAGGDFDLSWSGDIQGFLVIDGALGPNDVPASVIDAGDQDRIFDIQNAGTSELEINDVILRNGKPPEANSDGGAILIRDDDSQFDLITSRIESSDAKRWGGGMANLSGTAGQTIRVTQVEFSGNDAVSSGGGLWADGPQAAGTYVIRRSAFISNHSAQMGGGIYIRQTGALSDGPVVELYDSTVSGNTADVGGGGIAFAFGLGGTLFSGFTTIANNSTPAAGKAGGIQTTPSIDEFIQGPGMILAGNTAAGAPANCVPEIPTEFSPSTGTVESGPVACFGGATIADPLLAPLSYNATGDQTTRTHGPYDGSPALNTQASAACGVATTAQGVDQRSVARPVGTGCDAGAFEGSVGPAPAVTPPATPAAPAPAPAKCKKKKKKGKSAVVAKKCKKKKKK